MMLIRWCLDGSGARSRVAGHGALRTWIGVACLALGLAGPVAADQSPVVTRSARPTRITTPPEIDGVLDEAFWADVPPIGDMVQVDPDEGAPPTERTEIRIAFDDENLYLGIRLFDRDPSALIAKQMVLDADMTSDDRINLVIDTFFDHRNAYFFQINPVGTRSDALIENNSVFRRDWNGIWDAEATVDEHGWVAEFVIPFQTISLTTDHGRWGFEAERIIRRKNEKSRWGNPSNNRTIIDVAGIGELVGIVDIDATGIDITPNGALGHRRTRTFEASTGAAQDDSELVAEPGVDVFYKFHPSVVAGLTVNTNFLESPPDDLRTELSRFVPSFPERRAFFLQDAGIFEFGGLTGNAIPYFSRRIGRLDGRPLDIDAGVKLTGRLGPVNFGGLGITLPAQRGLPRTTLGVGRVQVNVLEESAVGVIGTYGDPRGEIGNGLVGADFQYYNSDFQGGNILRGNAFVMKSFASPGGGDDWAYGAVLEYPNDKYNGLIGYRQIGQGFDPRLGFVNRRGVHQFNGRARRRWRPNEYLRTVDTQLSAELFFDSDFELETGALTFTALKLTNQIGDTLSFQYSFNAERLRRQPFVIDPGVAIPLGDYAFHRGGIRLETANARPVSVLGELVYGSFYSGTLLQAIAGLTLRPTRYVFVSFEYEQDEGRLDEGDFTKRLARIRLNLAFTPEISWTNTLQYDRTGALMDLSSIFRWQVHPGDDVYVIVTQRWLEDSGRLRPDEGVQAVKLVWTFRF